MATQNIQNTRVANIVFTTEQFNAHATSVLLAGEFVYNSETGNLYIGDGTTQLSSLTPIQASLVKYTDIVNDLTTGGAGVPLSAEQGKALKALIDQIQGGQLTVPVATGSAVGGVLSGGDITVAGTGTVTVNNATQAGKLSTARTIGITGGATGSATFDGSADASINVTVDPAGHQHTIAQVTDLQETLNAKAPLESPTFTGTPTAPTADEGTNTTQLATTAFVKAAIDKHIASAQALEFKGTATPETEVPQEPGIGDVYIASEAGTIFGKTCEVGDMLVYNGTDWSVVQANIDGAVTGPASAVADHIATFDGATGKVIKDSGILASDVSGAVTKLAGIADGAEVNQNAFSTIMAGETSVAASAKTDTVTIKGAGGLTVSAEGKTITLTSPAAPGEVVAGGASGLMTGADKSKLDGIEAGAQVNVKPDWSAEAGNPAEILNKPAALKNPNAISVTVGTSPAVSYDGSVAQSVTITPATVGAVAKVAGTQGNVVAFGADGAIANSTLVAANVLQSTDTLILRCTLD